MTEPRFLLIDLERNEVVPLTTDQVQVAFLRIENQPQDGAYFEKINEATSENISEHPAAARRSTSVNQS